MSLSLKMLPCKKRRAAAAGPQSPRERGAAGEDGEPSGAAGSSSSGAADGGGSSAKPLPAARAGAPLAAGPGVSRGAVEASLKGGKRPPGRAAPGAGQEATTDVCAAAQVPEGRGSPEAVAEGKSLRRPSGLGFVLRPRRGRGLAAVCGALRFPGAGRGRKLLRWALRLRGASSPKSRRAAGSRRAQLEAFLPYTK
ncbi:translation initiation factor IF-2-like [Dryobates pubescens]|uniref:translation initiation factor IF-2-like n=1 Tax=Dryobates pubescens TaxID=118200 RepID=UPI0023B9A6AC|nr:translation initiation factor IF-2-like [Dryobates pubescens]